MLEFNSRCRGLEIRKGNEMVHALYSFLHKTFVDVVHIKAKHGHFHLVMPLEVRTSPERKVEGQSAHRLEAAVENLEPEVALRWDILGSQFPNPGDLGFCFSQNIPEPKSQEIPNPRDWDLFSSKI